MSQFFNAPRTRLSTVATAMLMMAACAKGQSAATPAAAPPPAAADAVAVVDGTSISKDEYEFYLKSLLQGKPDTGLTAEQKNQVLDELISIQLIATQAVKDGVDKDPDVAARLQVLRLRGLADAASQKFMKGKEPTDAEMHTEYDAAIGQMDKTEYHARHILVPTKEQAEQLIKKIKAGAKFEDVAKANSTDGSKTNGGDLGWFNLNRMVKPFGDAVKNLKKGEMTPEPVQTQFGWHIIKLEDTRESTPPAFDQVKPQLTNAFVQKKLQAYVEDLKKNAKIEKKM